MKIANYRPMNFLDTIAARAMSMYRAKSVLAKGVIFWTV